MQESLLRPGATGPGTNRGGLTLTKKLLLTSWQGVQPGLHSIGEVVAGRSVPINGPRHRTANCWIGSRWNKGAATRSSSQAVERTIHNRGYDKSAASGISGCRQAESNLVWTQAVLQLDCRQSGFKILSPLGIDFAVKAQHGAGVVVLHVDNGKNAAGVQCQLEVSVPRRLHVNGLGRHGDDQPRRHGSKLMKGARHGAGINSIFEVYINTIEAEFAHQRMHTIGEVGRAGGIRDADRAVLSAYGDDHFLPASMCGGDIGCKLRVGVAAQTG